MNTNTHETAIRTFLELVRAGLWPDVESTDIRNQGFTKSVNWKEMYRLATEQTVLGLVLAGIDCLPNEQRPPKVMLLQWIGEIQMLEQQNKEMNVFILFLFGKLSEADIHAVIVKGQGVAQSYEKPLWRSCGDIDLLLDEKNYEKAKALLAPLADEVEKEDARKKHLGIHVNSFLIELHGAMPFALSKRVDKIVDEVIGKTSTDNTFGKDDLKDVALPKADEHVVLVFTHFLHHFFIEGVGLRQICDWCRLLWTYKDSLNYGLMKSQITRMGLTSEWKAFASLAVDLLGMPQEAMPMYDSRFKNKGERVLARILKSGNMGHNNDLSYRAKYFGFTYKLVALWRRIKDFASLTKIFPLDAPRFFVHYAMRKV